MDFLGVGPLELIFILIIALIIFGPNDIVRAGKTLGSFMRKVVKSDGWRAFQQASKGMRDIPTTLMREAGLEEEDLRALTGMDDFDSATRGIENQISPWTTPPAQETSSPTNLDSGSSPDMVDSTEINAPVVNEEEPVPPPPGSPFSQSIDENN